MFFLKIKGSVYYRHPLMKILHYSLSFHSWPFMLIFLLCIFYHRSVQAIMWSYVGHAQLFIIEHTICERKPKLWWMEGCTNHCLSFISFHSFISFFPFIISVFVSLVCWANLRPGCLLKNWCLWIYLTPSLSQMPLYL